MSALDRLKSSRTWQVVFAVKLAALAAVWMLLDDGFHFGDRDGEAATETAAGETAGAKDGKGAKPSAEEKAASKTRKSFLSNLLELPELDPKSVQKDEVLNYLEIAERKQRQVEERLDLLKRREEQLKGLESSIDEKIRKLDEERKFFSQTIQQEKKLKDERTDKLVSMYAKMEPKKAAPIMEKLDKDLVVELFKQIPQKQVTAILEAMSPDSSVKISEYYGRVRSTREYDVLKEMNQSLRKEFDDCKGLPKTAE